MSFIKVPEEIFYQDLTHTQFKIICAIIKFMFEDNKTYIGNYKLAEFCRMDRKCIERNIKQLAAAGFVKIRARGAFCKSNEITLNFDLLTQRPSNGGSVDAQVFKSPTSQVFKSPTSQVFKSPSQVFKSPTHIDLKFKNQDLNLKTRETQVFKSPTEEEKTINQIAPADDAAGRSMPIQESAEEVRAEAPAANIDAKAFWRECQAEFKGITADVVFGQTGNRYFLRKKSKFTLTGHVLALEAADWLAARGISAEVLGENVHYAQETIIGEVA